MKETEFATKTVTSGGTLTPVTLGAATGRLTAQHRQESGRPEPPGPPRGSVDRLDALKRHDLWP